MFEYLLAKLDLDNYLNQPDPNQHFISSGKDQKLSLTDPSKKEFTSPVGFG